MRKRPNRPIDTKFFNASGSQSLDVKALDTPERILAYCREKGFINGSSTDIQKLIKDNSELQLDFEDLGEFDAYIEKLETGNFRIVINIRHPKKRQTFSMAHEYVHYQVHRKEIETMAHGEKILHRSEERNRIEYQANQYAAEILMPETEFRQIVRAKNGEVSKIAECFDVSQLAVRYRAKSLEIAGHGL